MEANQIMKRLFVLSALSLALAGCAQSKGALSRGASYPPSPVAITPVPSVYDTINEGMGGKALAQTALPNPNDPHWAGQHQISVAARPVPPGPPGTVAGPAAVPGAMPAQAAAGPVVNTAPMPRTEQPMGAPPAMAAAAAPAALAPMAQMLPTTAAPSPLVAGPAADLSTQSPAPAGLAPAPGPQTALAGRGEADGSSIPLGSSSPAQGPTVAPAADVAVSPSSPAQEPLLAPAADVAVSPSSPAQEPLLAPAADVAFSPLSPPQGPVLGPAADVAVSPSSTSMPARLARAASPASPAPKRAADPLLGPDPDLMPSMPDVPPVKSTARQAPPPAGPPALEAAPPAGSPLPELVQPPASGPGTTGAPLPVDPPIQLERSSAASKPANAGLAAVDLPLEAAPPTSRTVPVTAQEALLPTARNADSNVTLASSQTPKGPAKDRKYLGKGGGKPVARVGDEVITFHDLVTATKEALSKYPMPQGNSFDTAQAMQVRQQSDMVAREVLRSLIDRSLLVQEAKRHMKDKAMLNRAYEVADKIWHDEEVLPLERRYSIDSETKLKEKLAEEGRSLDGMRQNFRQYFLAQTFLHEKIKDRLNVDLPDLLKYYNDHVYQHAFDRPAQITWREIVVEIDRHKSREEAQAKVNALLVKVRRGEDFAKLARTESEGPTSSRNNGGLMQTTPGSYAVKPINDALDALPLGQVSGVLEGPDSFHILKVEKRRSAGPASFEEVLDEIKPVLVSQKNQEERDAFLQKLKRNALIKVYPIAGDESTLVRQ
jgi:peptidyl-prolyl cis-trans isomerase SurA